MPHPIPQGDAELPASPNPELCYMCRDRIDPPCGACQRNKQNIGKWHAAYESLQRERELDRTGSVLRGLMIFTAGAAFGVIISVI